MQDRDVPASEAAQKAEDQGQEHAGWTMRDCRKTYITCMHTYVHGKAGGCEKRASSLQPEGARRAAEEEACRRANLGRVDSQDCRYRRRVNRISSSPLTKASGAKV